jgi:hypothetical protein
MSLHKTLCTYHDFAVTVFQVNDFQEFFPLIFNIQFSPHPSYMLKPSCSLTFHYPNTKCAIYITQPQPITPQMAGFLSSLSQLLEVVPILSSSFPCSFIIYFSCFPFFTYYLLKIIFISAKWKSP